MKKFTIIKSYSGNNLYSLVLKSWEVDQGGKEINVDGLNITKETLNKVDEIERLFRMYGSKLKA